MLEANQHGLNDNIKSNILNVTESITKLDDVIYKTNRKKSRMNQMHCFSFAMPQHLLEYCHYHFGH